MSLKKTTRTTARQLAQEETERLPKKEKRKKGSDKNLEFAQKDRMD